MKLNPTTGGITLVAGSHLVGTHPVSIGLTDRTDTVYQQFDLTVVNVNTQPQIVSQPAPWAAVGREYRYQVIATDQDNDPLIYTLLTPIPGMVIDTAAGVLTWTPLNSQLGTHVVTIKVRDTVGAFVQQSWNLSVFDLANKPPAIVSEPDTIAWINGVYTYQVQAIDPEARPLTYYLTDAPQGMTVSSTGLITWPDAGLRPERASATIEVADDSLAATDQTWSIRLCSDTVPPTVSIIFSQNPVKTGKTVLISLQAHDNVVVASTALSVDNVAIEMNSANQYVYTTTRADTLDIRAIAVDHNGLADTAHSALFVNDAVDNDAPVVTLSHAPLNPTVGDRVTFTVTADDDIAIDAERVWLMVDNQYLPLVSNTATWTALRSGAFSAIATAYDLSGNFGKAGQTVTVANPMPENILPVAQITSPAEDSVVYGQTQVIGTADDDQFAYYQLSYITGRDTIEISRHDNPVLDGELGIFDGTILQNGDYTILLTAYDRSGNKSTAQTNVRVTANQKLGQFTLSFEDLAIPLPGFNLSVNRTYDSRDKAQGDFGYGWNIDLKTIRLSENRNQGIHWALADSGFDVITPIEAGFFDTVHIPRYYLRAIKPHTVTISIPGVRDQVFDANPQLFYQYDPNYGFMNYTPRQGTYSRLKQLDAGYFYRAMDDNLYRLDNMEPEPYDPDLYELTLVDGTRYIIDQKAGNAVTMIDRNGNRVSLKRDSISHSIGLKFAFIRDSENRITSISDGTGRVIRYTYDGHGNLQSVTDPNDNITRFKYAPDHYLTEIFDARGVRAVRTEYDDNGRMVRRISPAGDTMTFENDLDNAIARTSDFNGNETQFTYDERGNVLSKIDAGGNMWQYTYDDDDNLLSTINPDGTTSSSTWDNKGNELSSTDENGHATTRMYNDRGQTLTKTDALNRTTQYEYDPNGNELREIGPDGVITSEKTYAMWGVVATERDALGNSTSYGYDNLGRINSRTDPLGRITRYILDTRGRTLVDIGPSNDSTRYFYDNNGNQIMTIDATGDTSRSTYTIFNKVLTQTDVKGNTATYEYDLFGQLMRTIAADGSFTSSTYDAQGNVITATDQVGRVTTSVYDFANRQIKTIFNDGTFTSSELNAVGRRVASIDANGNRTEYEYDPVGNNTVVRDALGNETHYEYDDMNRRKTINDALAHRTGFEYDDYDRLTKTIFADGTYKTTEYDAASRKVAEVDQANKRTEFEYDPVGNLIKVTDAMGHETRYGYDSKNNRISQTDANNHTTHLDYDRLGRMIKRTYPGGDNERFGYNGNGSMVYSVKGLDSLSYQYDSRNRETLRTYQNSGHIVKTSYTADGRTDTVTDYRGATVYIYDDRGRQSKVTNPDGTYIESRYDANGNRTELETPWGNTRYTYDLLNRMKTVRAPDNGLTEYFYNPVGNRDSLNNANGTSSEYHYDNLNRLTDLVNHAPDGTVISRFAYDLNAAGIRTAVTEEDGSRVDYAYDDLYRLTGETRAGSNAYSITYAYDNVGNRLEKTSHDGTTTYMYNTRDQLISENGPNGSITYAYDAGGRMTNKTEQSGTTNYSWIDDDRMFSVDGPGTSASYLYDAQGRRVSETTSGETKNYLIDAQLPYGQVIAETDESGTLIAEYGYGIDRISRKQGSVISTYHTDGQGSIRELTNATGDVTDTWTYSAFGEIIGRTGSTENAFTYTGEQWDPNTGFFYLRARWYDPREGRFTSVDPYSGDPQAPVSLHRYLYGNSSPLGFKDPSGNNSIAEMAALLVMVGTLPAISIPVTKDALPWKTVTLNNIVICGMSTDVSYKINRANQVYQQAHILFKIGCSENYDEESTTRILGEDWLLERYNGPTSEESRLFSIYNDPSSITIYYISGFSNERRQDFSQFGEAFPSNRNYGFTGIALQYLSSGITLGHEIGHMLLNDNGEHPNDDPMNLMYQGGRGTKLEESQIMKMRMSSYAQ
jgi:RHS repeat-associated protein